MSGGAIDVIEQFGTASVRVTSGATTSASRDGRDDVDPAAVSTGFPTLRA